MEIRLFGLPLISWGEKRGYYNTDQSPTDFWKEVWSGGKKTKAGEDVNEQSALAYSAVFSCVRILSETLASLPVNVFKNVDAGREIQKKHPVQGLIHTTPNKINTPFMFKQTMMVFAALWGNGYARIVRRGDMRPIALDIIHPECISPVQVSDELYYVIQIPGRQKETIPSWEMLHIPGLSVDGFEGIELIEMAKEAIGLGLATEGFGAEFFGNGANTDVILSYPGKLSQKGKDNLGGSFDQKYRNNKEKTMVLEEGVKAERITIPPEQAQFLATRRFQVEDVSRFFRVPLHMINELTKSSFNNIEHQGMEFVRYTMLPWVIKWEEEMNRKLFYEAEKDEYFTDFDLNILLRGDAAAQATIMTAKFNSGALTSNEIRASDGKNRVDGGDTRYVNANLMPVGDDGMPIRDSDGERDKDI